jgi:kojibiose phosphorylase
VRISIDGEALSTQDCAVLDQRRTLDLLQGILVREWRLEDASGRITHLVSIRFLSLHDRHTAIQRIVVTPENYDAAMRIELLLDGATANASGDRHLSMVTLEERAGLVSLLSGRTGKGITLAVAALSSAAGDGLELRHSVRQSGQLASDVWEWTGRRGESCRIDKVVSIFTGRDTSGPAPAARARVSRAASSGFNALLRRHRSAWARRWETADVTIDGDEVVQRAARFAIYHLIAAANADDERSSVGARLLTGEGYLGHVFWDTEIFMLPFFTFTDPESARSLLMYRYHTLDAARARARKHGFRGAMFSWESSDTGEEQTPSFVRGPGGTRIPVLCGTMEQHIVADVAFATWQYWLVAQDVEFMAGPGIELLVECARFWASRLEQEEDGNFHIRHVIGPDEYHEDIDDNAFTNYMAQWTLRRAVEAARGIPAMPGSVGGRTHDALGVTAKEIQDWETKAAHTAFRLDEASGLIEQFEGYHSLSELDTRGPAMLPTPLDVLAGHERIQTTQLIKQADVVMLLALHGGDFPREVTERNFRYYEPRSNHGSSLSPAVHALVASRIGDVRTARNYLQRCAEIDLFSVTGNSRDGVHGATLGGLWQALVFGFGGVSVSEAGIRIDPVLHPSWQRLRISFRYGQDRLIVNVGSDGREMTVSISGPEAVHIAAGDRPHQMLASGKSYRVERADCGWLTWVEAGKGETTVLPGRENADHSGHSPQ